MAKNRFFLTFIDKPKVAFYVLLVYVFLVLGWWMYSNVQLIQTLFNDRVTSTVTLYETMKLTAEDAYQSTDYRRAKLEQQRNIIQTLTQGAFLLLLLAVVSWKTRQVLVREEQISLQQSNFLLSVTHELKSPITSARLAMETLGNPNLKEDQRSRFITNSLRDMDRLQTLVENMLLASRIESNIDAEPARLMPINLSNTVQRTAHRLVDLAASKDIDLQYHIQPNLSILGDEYRITSICSNLIENAIKYSPKGTTVKVILNERQNYALLQVADQGFGISDKDKQQIFGKFYRIGDERTRTTKGTGLGLFIVKSLVNMHKGTITVSDNTPKGSIFTVKLPIYHGKEA